MRLALGELPFTSPWLLAPMDGVTDPAFRKLLFVLHAPEDLGGAFTEFVRVTQTPVPQHIIARHLGTQQFPMPVGLQLMGNNLEAMAMTARTAVELGAPLVDINFGCPARGPFRHCAGSSLLSDPAQIERIVKAVAEAVPEVPTTAKIRSGIEDDLGLEDVARAAESGGAQLLTVHCRTKTEGYQEAAIKWSRIARAVKVTSIPVCGNGGASSFSDLEGMRRETGCAFVMIGRGAIADPWVFSGKRATKSEAARFLLDYGEAMAVQRGHADASSSPSRKRVAGRIKQLLRYWTAGDLVGDERESWLRENDPDQLFGRLASFL